MVNARRRRQTRNLRPNSNDPIAHNEAVALFKRMRYVAQSAKAAARSLRKFGAALEGARFVIVDEVPPERLAELAISAAIPTPGRVFLVSQPTSADPDTFANRFQKESA